MRVCFRLRTRPRVTAELDGADKEDDDAAADGDGIVCEFVICQARYIEKDD